MIKIKPFLFICPKKPDLPGYFFGEVLNSFQKVAHLLSFSFLVQYLVIFTVIFYRILSLLTLIQVLKAPELIDEQISQHRGDN